MHDPARPPALNAPVAEPAAVAGAAPAAFVRHLAEIDWREFPGHFGGALSKPLVRPETCGSRRIDFRISCYQPMAHVQEHVHRVQEQVYHVLQGAGLLTLDGRRVVLRADEYVFVPPGVRHSIANNGTDALVFLVVTSPVDDGDEAPL